MSTAEARRAPHWSGMLCAETLDDIAARMTEVLGGNYFTMVACNSYDENSHKFSGVEVTTSQWISTPISTADDSGYSGISWSTPTYSMGVSTKAKTQSEGRSGGPHKYVHFTFEHDRVVIDHYAPARYRLRWTFAVERHDPEGPINGGAS